MSALVVDTSALAAIIFGEPERAPFIEAILAADRALVAIPNVVEARLVAHGRKGQAGVLALNDFLALPVFEWVAVGKPEADAAYAAFVLFGKGSGHAASLNYCDLFSYALAKVRDLPLLYKGDDFQATDIRRVL